MSTFFGGAQFVNLVAIAPASAIALGVDPVVYTCPAGRYAEVFLRYVDGGTIKATLVQGLILPVAPPASDIPTVSDAFVLYPGENLFWDHINNGAPIPLPYNVIVKEYAIP